MVDDLLSENGMIKRHVIKDNSVYLPLIIKGESIGYIMAETNGNGKEINGRLEGDAFILETHSGESFHAD